MPARPNKAPTHRAYAVTESGSRHFWREIGAAWSHADGDGFNLKLDYLPLNGADIVVRKPLPAEERPEDRADAAEPGRARSKAARTGPAPEPR